MGFELRPAHGKRVRKEQLGIETVGGAEIASGAPGGTAGTAAAAEPFDSLGQKCADREIASHSP